MTIKSRLLSIIPSIGLGSLLFMALITYQSIVTFTSVKQQEFLQNYSQQILLNKPDSLTKSSWTDWLNNNDFTRHSGFMAMLLGTNDRLLTFVNGNSSKVDNNFAIQLANELQLNEFPEQHTTHNDMRYIWYKSRIPGTSYSLLLVHASKPELFSFYFKYLGVPMMIAAAVVLWVSLWLAMILSNLYMKLDTQKRQMEHNALHDPLTGLPNRILLADRLQHEMETAKREDSSFAICMIDLDRFKEINDALGHEYGDKLLVEVANRIKSILREVDTIARIGGDEFIIILHNTKKERATKIARRISSKLKKEFVIDNEAFHISGSIGVAIYPEHGVKPEILLKCADLTMYQAKQHNYDYVVYNPEQDNMNNNSLFLFTDLVAAINNNNFVMHYQPKLDQQTNQVTSVEALIRWRHPTQGYIQPQTFIPIAEQTGLIRDITRWGLQRIIQDQVALKERGIDVSISINLSAHDLDDEHICDHLVSLVNEHNATPADIILEITETAMFFNPSVTDKILNNLHEHGFTISIDDFGTGYSSLSNLQRLHVKEIKIDRCFVIDMHENENNNRIVRGTIGLAHDLGIQVVAEGVESGEVLDLLKELDCDMLQGYHICKPLPLYELIPRYWGQLNPLEQEN